MKHFVPEGKVEIPELQLTDKVELDPAASALIVVDMQNDFVSPKGNLYVPAAQTTVENIRKLLETARNRSVRIAFTQDSHFEGDREWEIWPEHCRHGSWGWEVIEELKPQPGELICQKNRYDGFYGTWLEHFLAHSWKVRHVILVGTVANICVLHTAASAGLRWFHVVLPADGTSALTDFDQASALRQIVTLYGGNIVRSVEDIRFS